jgi:hypothetical protein
MGAALLALIVILILFGGGGLALHALWYLLVAALILWAIGFVVSSTERHWYRW